MNAYRMKQHKQSLQVIVECSVCNVISEQFPTCILKIQSRAVPVLALTLHSFSFSPLETGLCEISGLPRLRWFGLRPREDGLMAKVETLCDCHLASIAILSILNLLLCVEFSLMRLFITNQTIIVCKL